MKFNVLMLSAVLVTFATTMSMTNFQIVLGLPAFPCISCAKYFAPGQEKNTAESNFDSGAKAFPPGQEAKIPIPTCSGCNGKSFAPGQEKKDIGTIDQ